MTPRPPPRGLGSTGEGTVLVPKPCESGNEEKALGRVTETGSPAGSRNTRSKAMLGRFVRRAVAFLKEEDGPTAVEYAVMLALIIVVLFAAVATIGTLTNDMYGDLSLQGVKPGGSGS